MVKVHYETMALLRSSAFVVRTLDDDLQPSIESMLRQEATVLSGRDESLMPD